MSIAKSPFILGGVPSEHTNAIKRSSGQKNDNISFSEMVTNSSPKLNESESVQEQNSEKSLPVNVISRLFANGLAMGESQHQQNEMVLQSVLPKNQKDLQGQSVSLISNRHGISLNRESTGMKLNEPNKGISLDSKRDVIFSARNIALNRKHGDHTMNHNLTKNREKNSIDESSASIGQLSALFESGSAGIAAIGYDRTGGTSYGKYQIASKTGTMNEFISFLEKEAPDIAERLKNAGPADTGSRNGKMPEVWQQIAAEQPEKFAALQKDFISERFYQPVLNGIKAAGYNLDTLSPVMKEVLWSTAVQHGPSGAVRIFTQVATRSGIIKGSSINEAEQRQLIENIYELRGTQFSSSTVEIQASALRRMQNEKNLALSMLESKETRA